MNVAEIEALFAHVREQVGGFPALLEDHIAHLIDGFREPVAEVTPEEVTEIPAEAAIVWPILDTPTA